MTSKYCFDYIEAIEKLLDDSLAEIASDAIRADSENALDFLVLGGGYGRGEGGIAKEADGSYGLYNDLDFFVVAKDGANGAKLDSALKPVSEKWTKKLGIDVDFGAACTAKYIVDRLNMQMWREMALGGIAVLGGRERFAKTFAIPDAALPPSETAKLMFNRLYGFWLAQNVMCKNAFDIADINFIARNINKTALASGEAMLSARGVSKFKSLDRLAALESLDMPDFPQAKALRALYRRAVGFKRSPDRPDIETLKTRADETKILAFAVLENIDNFIRRRDAPLQLLKNFKKNILLQKAFQTGGVGAPLFSNPFPPALHILKNFIENPRAAAPEKRKALETIRERIN